MITKKDIEKELAKRELARRDFSYFIKYIKPDNEYTWHIDAICKKLQAVSEGKIKRLIITMPPRHSKSENVSRMFPAWYFGGHSKEEIIQSSYGASLAEDFGRDVRNIMNSQEYKNVFPEIHLADDSQAKGRWSTKDGGNYNAVGVGGAITGKGGHLIIDDPVKNREEAESLTIRDTIWNWYTSTAYTRLPPNGWIVIVMTRWHEDDLVGRILVDGHKWDVLHLKAIATEDEEHRKQGEALWTRFDTEKLLDIRKNIGEYDFSALYQGMPVDPSTQEFKKEWIKYVTWEEVQKMQTNCYLTIDPAMSKSDSADYTGYTLNFVNNENKWHVKSWKKRVNATELVDDLFALQKMYNLTRIGIETTQYTWGLKPYLDEEMNKRNIYLTIEELKHGGTQKETRIRTLVPRYQRGQVYHIKDECMDLEEQMFQFPKGRWDDVIDSLAYQEQISKSPISSFVEAKIQYNIMERRNLSDTAE